MQAQVLHGTHQALQFEQVDDPKPLPGEAVVDLQASALNHRDLWIQKGQYAGLRFPLIPGSDGAGTIREVGPGVDPSWIGQEVVICPSLFWGEDERAPGSKFEILGLPRPGTWAQRVAVPTESLFPKPPHLSWPEAAALGLAGLTAYRALVTRAQLQKGERVLITGIGGGVAQSAFQWAHSMGALIWVTSGHDDKITAALNCGARGGANYRHPSWAATLKESVPGFDVIIDGAGGSEWGALLDLAVPGGRIVSYGATNGPVPELALRRVFWKQLTLLGTSMGTTREFQAMLNWVQLHLLRPAIHSIFPLPQANEALALLASGVQTGKVILSVPGSAKSQTIE